MRRVLFVAFAYLSFGCASIQGTAEQARFHESCEDLASLPGADARTKLEREVLARSAVLLRVRAVGSGELFERIGTQLYKDDITLLAWDAINRGQPCCSMKTSVSLVTGEDRWPEVREEGFYRHANLDTPVEPRLNPDFSLGGALGDFFIGLLTAGQLDAKLRGGPLLVGPSRPGNATLEQHRAIARLRLVEQADEKQITDQTWIGKTAHRTVIVAPPPNAHGDLALSVRVTLYLAEDSFEPSCPFTIERRFPLPPGKDAGERVTAMLRARGDEIVIGQRP